MDCRLVFCAVCNLDVEANLVKGKAVFGRKGNNKNLLFWECPCCRNHVSIHKNGRHSPRGIIVGPEVRDARITIHELADPLWKSGHIEREKLFRILSKRIGRRINHIGEIRNTYEANEITECLCILHKEWN